MPLAKALSLLLLFSMIAGMPYAQAGGTIQLKKKAAKKRIDAQGNLVTEEAAVEDLYSETNVGSIAQLDPRAGRAFFTHTWYIKASSTVNYFNLGSEFQGVIRQIEGAFGGDKLNMKLLNVNADFSMTTAQKVKRAPTHFLPTGNLALGFYFGMHQLELEFGLAGLVPLKTIDLDTTMTLHDQTAGCSGTACQLANLGFVDPVSRTGQYSFRMTMNEDVWIMTPSLSYDYVFMVRKWGRMSLGGGAGAMILSTSQQIAFKAVRIDPIVPTPPEKPLEARVLQGTASSTNVTDIGPIFRLHVTYRPPPITKFWNTQTEIRLGANYGFVYLNRDVDGVGQAVLGNTLYGSFPLTSLGFKSQERNRFEMLGGFIQVGIIF
ncbi:MAG: hypothetical protein N2Z22_00390 [Turneriella sp.]|nr:hypothetical protein [Turneriella sp.]